MARHKVHDNLDTPLLTLLSPTLHADRTAVTMGVSWQTPEQKAFIESYLPLYFQHSTDETLKAGFWPNFKEKWFESWPLPEPSPEVVEKEGSVEKAKKVERSKKVCVSMVYLLMN